jgi:hypothetical protein
MVALAHWWDTPNINSRWRTFHDPIGRMGTHVSHNYWLKRFGFDYWRGGTSRKLYLQSIKQIISSLVAILEILQILRGSSCIFIILGLDILIDEEFLRGIQLSIQLLFISLVTSVIYSQKFPIQI